MTNINKTQRNQPAQKTNPKSDVPPIHIMYGIVWDRLGVMKNDVKSGIDLANVALKSGQLSARDEKEIHTALGNQGGSQAASSPRRSRARASRRRRAAWSRSTRST